MNYSFFYSRGSAGYVRGEQIADLLGGKKNPESGFENDICVYVKILPPENPPKHSYLDVDDAPRAVTYLKEHPEVGVIATSDYSNRYLSRELNREDIVTIPHAHCNYERWVRPDREVKIIGIIGSKTSFQYDIMNFRQRLKEIGLELSYNEDYWKTYQYSREKVCEFYKFIDVQVVWRPKMYAPTFKNPNKLVNAGSFGIPTISYPEDNFLAEWGDNFIQADTIDYMIWLCNFLRAKEDAYNLWSKKALVKAEECHKDNIIELYRGLK